MPISKKVFVYEAKRSAIGKYKKSFSNTTPISLATQVTKCILEKSNIKPQKIDRLYLGNVLSAGLGQNIARQVLINSGIPKSKTATTINMVCGSGMKAIYIGYNDIKLGDAHLVLSGGVENMSLAPMLKKKNSDNEELIDSMLNDGLIDSFSSKHMGLTAENIARKYNISKYDQDGFSLSSQLKTKLAYEKNIFSDEIVNIVNNNGDVINVDEFPRFDTSFEKIQNVKPCFKKNGTVSAANASGINDGCSLLLIGDKSIKCKPLAEIIGFAEVGCDPKYMGMGPYYAINKIIKKYKLNINDIDLFEINEAFASQSCAVIKELVKKYNLNYDEFVSKINVNGGAIALGHPLGASGARIMTTLIYEMKKRKAKYGIASLCIGGGMGIAALLKNMEE